MNRRDEGSFVIGAIIGGAAAAIAALLFAPKPGKELRRDISNEFHSMVDTAHDYADIAKEKGYEVVDAAKETTEDIRVSLKDKTSSIKGQITDTTKNLKGDFRKAKSEVDSAMAHEPEPSHPDALDSQKTKEVVQAEVQSLADEAARHAENPYSDPTKH